MPLIVENPQHRKRGTASRHNHVPRYQQPDVDEWRAMDDVNKVPLAEENNIQENLVVREAVERSSFRSGRRRRKRKRVSVDDNDFSFEVASSKGKESADTSVTSLNKSRNDSKHAAKGNASVSAANTRITKDTPMPPEGQAAAKKPSVSPEDEIPKPAPETPFKNSNMARPGSRVLEVEYSADITKKACADSENTTSTLEGAAGGSNTESNDEVDRLTSKNAFDSPRPYVNDISHVSSTNKLSDENPPSQPVDALEAKTLGQVVQDGQIVTKERFFSESSLCPVQTIAIGSDISTRPFKGQVGSTPVHWSQASGGAGKHLLLTIDAGSDGDSRARRQLEWEATVLDWIHSCCGSDNVPHALQCFPTPLWLLEDSPGNDSHVLCLNLTNQRESSLEFDVLGTLEDLVHMHAMFNNGPLPETLCARIVVQVMDCVRLLHHSGVTHDNLGLDSFLLVCRRLTGTEEYEWFLACTGLGSEAKVRGQNAGDEDTEEGSAWHFKHDLYSVANIAHLLLSGGVPLSFARGEDTGMVVLQSNHFVSSIFLRGRLAWQALFRSLLNPPNASCSLRLSGSDQKWNDDMTHALEMIRALEMNVENNVLFLNQLKEHGDHVHATGFAICDQDRFPVKLITDSSVEPEEVATGDSQGTDRNEQYSTREVELMRALREKDRRIGELELRLEHSENRAEEYRNLSSDSTSAMQQAVNERHDLEQLADRQRSGFEAALRDKDRSLENLRNRNIALEQHARTSYSANEMRAAQERIQSLEAEQSLANSKLKSARGIISILQQEKRIAEKRVEVAGENIQVLEELRGTHEEAMQQLKEEHETGLANINKQLALLQTELASEIESRKKADSTVESLQATHDKSMQQLRAEHETAISKQAKRLVELETELSNETELRKKAEISIEALQVESAELKKSLKSQSRIYEDSLQSRSSEINRLETLVRGYEESQRLLEERNEELEYQKSSFEAELSTRDATLHKVKGELGRRVEELESRLARQRQQTGESTRAPPPRKAAGTSNRQGSLKGTFKGSFPTSRSSYSSSRGSSRSNSEQSASLRRRQASAFVIPGQSLTQLAGIVPDNVPSYVRPSSQTSNDSQRSTGGKSRLTFGDPHSDSE